MQSAEHHNAAFFAGSADRAATKSAQALEVWQFINILLSALATSVFWRRKIIVFLFISSVMLFTSSCNNPRGGNENMKTNENSVRHINPDGLHKNPAYSQAIVVSGVAKTVYVGGQNAVDASGAIVGKGDLKAQTEQVFKNLQIALEAGGAKLENVVKWNVYVVEGQPIEPGFEVFQRVWGKRLNPPVITSAFVSKLAQPDFLVEIDAVAVVPQ
jgi:enamine deaminase RidA (YjgF/YER057c/UK114 family)